MAVQRVVVAVSPRLLGDALCRSLAQDGLEVISIDVDTDLGGEYDVAVVSAGRETEVQATHVISLPEGGSGATGLSPLTLLRNALAALT